MPPSDKAKRTVWVKAAGRCSMCRELLCIDGSVPALFHFIGDVAHIVAEENDGPRGSSSLTLDQRNSEPNLLLLCKPHHKIVDDDPQKYTIESLTETKASHEKWVSSSLMLYPVWETRLFHLYYINVPRLSLLSALRGATLNLDSFEPIRSLHELGWELNRLMAGFKNLLQTIQVTAIPLDSIAQREDLKGMIVSFDHKFRTKNIQLPQNRETFETLFSGNLKTDPHIYLRVGDRKLVANIDLRWITTTTAFCQFRPSSGQNHFAGLGFINSIDEKAKIIHMTPYVIGLPSNPVLDAFYGSS